MIMVIKNSFLSLIAITSMVHAAEQTIINHRELASQELNYLEQRGGPLTQEELEHIKQKAACIVNSSQLRNYIAAIATKAEEKSTLIGASRDEIFDTTTADDIKLLADCIDYMHQTSNTTFAEVSHQLHTAANARDYKKQLFHSLAYLTVLGLEMETLLQELNARVEVTKTIKNGNLSVQLSGN